MRHNRFGSTSHDKQMLDEIASDRERNQWAKEHLSQIKDLSEDWVDWLRRVYGEMRKSYRRDDPEEWICLLTNRRL